MRSKAHPELADEVGILLLVTGQRLKEGTGAGLGDGAQIVDHLLAVHADAVIGNGDGAGLFVEGQVDLQLLVAFVQGIIRKCLEPQLVAGIGGVGDQLTQEDLLVGIEEWIMRCSSCLTSVSNPNVSFCASTVMA